MIHTDLIEMLDALSRRVDQMRDEARTMERDSREAVTLRVHADAVERLFLTDDTTGEVFPHFSNETRERLVAKMKACEEQTRRHDEAVRRRREKMGS